ncbi:glutamate racemase [Pedobacter sp. JCM 36344]|uniref:glutamate racemase n=1 Tax=Pedobacter sp. JCM 36344 TaxID=3374280 RepID=UPI00397AE444
MTNKHPIGIFDSGYGGLTVFKSIAERLPQYDYIYLGDNARAPYGDNSFEAIYQYTLECVEWLFSEGCQLVILACNTASAKALRTIQQKVLPVKYPTHRVLGVIRPTAEVIGNFTESKIIGVMGTRGTVNSESYLLEINKYFPEVSVYQQSCPMWVPLVENNEHLTPGADFFVEKYLTELLNQNPKIDTILLACTHYPLLIPKIKRILSNKILLVGQGDIVSSSLERYLDHHIKIKELLAINAKRSFYTTGDQHVFDEHASVFFGDQIFCKHIDLKEQ